MNFQTNKQTSIKIIGDICKPKCPSMRIKTTLSEHSDPDQTFKRFQRSNTKIVVNSSSNASLLNRPQVKAYDSETKNKIPLMQSKVNQEPSMIKSVSRELNLSQSHIMNQKFIPNSMHQLKIREKSQTIHLDPNDMLSKSRTFESNNSQLYKQLKTQSSYRQQFPFRTIINCSSENQLKNSQLILDVSRKQSTPIFEKESPRNRLKNLFQKHSKTFSYCQIANTSTQSSIPQNIRVVKKVTIASQTQSKKCNHMAVNTLHIKPITVKTQTEQSGNTLHKIIEDLRNKIIVIEQENKKLKIQLGSLSKQKEELNKLVKQGKQIGQKSYRSISIHRNSQSNLPKLIPQSQQQSFKQISLQALITSLKQQIQTIKSGQCIKKTEQILQAVKRQNVSLVNQLQAVSLKCRVLQQNNNDLIMFQQESRKLKLEIKYFRGSIKDHQMQIQRLKGEIKKMRNMPKMHGTGKVFQQSRVLSGWGSETDSLNLSVSFIRD